MIVESDSQMVRSGMVAIIGPPNAGKSTLMNNLLGQKISIVTAKPQTTRNRILGVVNDAEYQIVLIDTPGLHKADQLLNKEMVRIALESLEGVDLILFLLDVKKMKEIGEEKKAYFAKYLQETSAPVLLVLNKVDLIDKRTLLPIMEVFGEIGSFSAIMPVSAKHSQGMEELLTEILRYLPYGPRYFPEDIPTDSSERFLVSEIIREKIFIQTGQEIPYSTAVVIDSFVEEKKLITIHASIVLERDSQKGIVIGKGGKKLKKIGSDARQDIERMVGVKVLLKLWVKVKKNWSQNEKFLRELGF